MNLFAKILSHGFALILVALLAVGLVYRGDLFPGMKLPEFLSLDSGTEQNGDVSTAKDENEQAPAVVGESSVEAPVVETSPAIADGVSEAIPAETKDVPGDTVSEAGQVDNSVSAPDSLSSGDSVEEGGAVTEPVNSNKMGVEEKQETAATTSQQALPVEHTDAEIELTPAEPEEPGAMATPADVQDERGADAEGMTGTEASVPGMGNPDLPAPAVNEDGNKVNPYQILASAREAFWLRDYVAAEQQYKELINLDPANPDGYGELGNMYFSQGEWEKAAAAYFDAGVRLLDQGMFSEAQQLVEVIRGLNGTQADELEQKINNAVSPRQ
jgi:hypothetical protein